MVMMSIIFSIIVMKVIMLILVIIMMENLLPLLLALNRISSELSPPMLLHWLNEEFDEDKRLIHAAALAEHNAEEHYVEDCAVRIILKNVDEDGFDECLLIQAAALRHNDCH